MPSSSSSVRSSSSPASRRSSTCRSSCRAWAPRVLDGVPPDSSTRVVADTAALARRRGCDAIVAIGGGSVIDTAKAVNILLSEGGDDLHAYAGSSVLKRRLKPFVVIPTTSGTGSEVTNVAVIKDADTGVKLPFVSQYLL